MPRVIWPAILITALMLTACGYKGDLYLPKENDKAKFGPLQTGLEFKPKQPPNQAE